VDTFDEQTRVENNQVVLLTYANDNYYLNAPMSLVEDDETKEYVWKNSAIHFESYNDIQDVDFNGYWVLEVQQDSKDHSNVMLRHFNTGKYLMLDHTTDEADAVLTNKVSIDELRNMMEAKANQSDINAELDQVAQRQEEGFHEFAAKINQMAQVKELSQVLQQLESKADLGDMHEHLKNKANKQTVANALHRKANKAEVEEEMNRKADRAEIDRIVEELRVKANSEDLQALSERLANTPHIEEVDQLHQQLSQKLE